FVVGLGGGCSGSRGEVVEWTGEEERVVLRGWRENRLVVDYLTHKLDGQILFGTQAITDLDLLRASL
nr:hypothetical protein [Tanacetum cinerariifolium]